MRFLRTRMLVLGRTAGLLVGSLHDGKGVEKPPASAQSAPPTRETIHIASLTFKLTLLSVLAKSSLVT